MTVYWALRATKTRVTHNFYFSNSDLLQYQKTQTNNVILLMGTVHNALYLNMATPSFQQKLLPKHIYHKNETVTSMFCADTAWRVLSLFSWQTDRAVVQAGTEVPCFMPVTFLINLGSFSHPFILLNTHTDPKCSCCTCCLQFTTHHLHSLLQHWNVWFQDIFVSVFMFSGPSTDFMHKSLFTGLGE